MLQRLYVMMLLPIKLSQNKQQTNGVKSANIYRTVKCVRV